jgi:hypothetical protein
MQLRKRPGANQTESFNAREKIETSFSLADNENVVELYGIVKLEVEQ